MYYQKLYINQSLNPFYQSQNRDNSILHQHDNLNLHQQDNLNSNTNLQTQQNKQIYDQYFQINQQERERNKQIQQLYGLGSNKTKDTIIKDLNSDYFDKQYIDLFIPIQNIKQTNFRDVDRFDVNKIVDQLQIDNQSIITQKDFVFTPECRADKKDIQLKDLISQLDKKVAQHGLQIFYFHEFLRMFLNQYRQKQFIDTGKQTQQYVLQQFLIICEQFMDKGNIKDKSVRASIKMQIACLTPKSNNIQDFIETITKMLQSNDSRCITPIQINI